MAFVPQNCSNFYLVQPGIKQNFLQLHFLRRFSQKRSIKNGSGPFITSRARGSAASPKSCPEPSRICKNSSAKVFLTVAAIKIGLTETFAVRVIQASFWSFLFAKENPRLQNNEQNARKEAWFYIHATLPPRGLQKVSNSQKIQQELENLWGKHATKAPTHMLYHHLTQVEQFSLCIKQKLSFSNKK